jgi:hypothetical protein
MSGTRTTPRPWQLAVLAAAANLVSLAGGSAVAEPAAPVAAALDLSGEARRQFDDLAGQMTPARRAWFEKVASQAYRREALILPEDRDPLDVVLRRTRALLADQIRRGATGDLSALTANLDRLAAEADKLAPEAAVVVPVAPKKTSRSVPSVAPSGDDPLGELGLPGAAARAPARPAAQLKPPSPAGPRSRRDVFAEVCEVRRRIAFANPLLDFNAILFAARSPLNSHSANVYYGFHTSGQPGGGIFVLNDPFGPQPSVRNVLAGRKVQAGRLKGQELVPGAFGWPDLSYDGKTAVFSYTQGKPDRGLPAYMGWCETASFHLFKVAVDGTGDIVQLTDGVDDDAHPCWLPNGRIAFVSTRRGGANRCGGPQKVNTLHSVNGDGSNMTCLSYHETNEWSPSVRGDGMILYSRWDYVDRGDCIAHHPWTCFPDGRDPRAIHGNFPLRKGDLPDLEADLQEIPGSRSVVGTASGHHGPGLSGSLIILDTDVEDDGAMTQVKRLTPETGFPETPEGGKGDFATAWPLNEDYFLCFHRGGLYLIDSFGNRELLLSPFGPGCMDPVPLRPRPRPPVLNHSTIAGRPPTPAADPKHKADGKGDAQATIVCVNVYDSTKPWPEGARIAALRVVQLFPKQHGTWMGFPEIGGTGESLARGVLGAVPVEKDGSVHFACPPGKLIYFQALDEQGRAVQSMQSGTYVHPGERLVCQGCHERRVRTPVAPSTLPLALRRAPSTLEAGPEGSYPILYPKLVQPVLDKHCVGCHKEKNPKMDLSAEVVERRKGRPGGPGVEWVGPGTYWSKSYVTLSRYGFGFSGKPPHRTPAETTPGQFGALASRLYPMLQDGHKGRVKLSPEDMRRIILWLDCNTNFYGAYHDTEAQARGQSVSPAVE